MAQGPRKTTFDEFVAKANAKHCGKYTYEKFKPVFVNMGIKGPITCVEHGDFMMAPSMHLYGIGCKACGLISSADKRRYTIDEFTTKANDCHNSFYDYSLVEYNNSGIPIKIVCPLHGMFEQEPRAHLRGDGCKKCGIIKCSDSHRKSIDEVITQSNIIHNFEYDYTPSIDTYVSDHSKMDIRCKTHGVFSQVVSSHLQGVGCSKCNGGSLITTEEFIRRAKIQHGNLYDYRLVVYVKASERVWIICKNHGKFDQVASEHLYGYGCSKCHYKNQTIVGEVLEMMGIDYERITFKINGKRYYPDFYLPDYNLIIEYNGQQHYEPVIRWAKSEQDAEDKLLKQRLRDSNLRYHCISNGYGWLEINGIECHGRKKIENFLTDYFTMHKRK